MGGLFIENLPLDIFQLMSFFYCINWFSFFQLQFQLYFIFQLVIVTVNFIIFFSYFAISVTVTVNLNNTVSLVVHIKQKKIFDPIFIA